jgi:hypothetical protein
LANLLQSGSIRHKTYERKLWQVHENTFGSNSERVQKWKSALVEVCSLSGKAYTTGYVIYFQILLFSLFHNKQFCKKKYALFFIAINVCMILLTRNLDLKFSVKFV